MLLPGQHVCFPAWSLEGHPGLESETAHPGLQSTLVCTFGTRLSSVLFCKSLDLWLLSPLQSTRVFSFSTMEFSTFPSCKTLDSYLWLLSVAAHFYWSVAQCHAVARTLRCLTKTFKLAG